MKKKRRRDQTPGVDLEVTAVGPAPTEDEWDGPTREVSAEEAAVLAHQSTTAVEAETTTAVGTENHSSDEAPADAPGAEGSEALPVGEGSEAASLELADAVSDRLESVLESLLFASDRPLTLADLKRLTGERQGPKLTEALDALRARREDSGIQLVQVAGGWHLRTHPGNVSWVSRLVAGRPPRLSRAMLETLAIVAYRQPVTRPEIDEIRGVDCGPVLGTLLERGFVRMIGKKEEVGRPILYGTTPEFLRTFSLRDLAELPTLREFHELSEAHLDEVAKVDGETAGPAAGAAVGAGDTDATAGSTTPTRPPMATRRQLDPEEDDELLSELEQAASAAAKATDTTRELPADDSTGSSD